MKCPVCSTRVDDNIAVCPNCGMTLKKNLDSSHEVERKSNKKKPKYLRGDLSASQKANRLARLFVIAVLLIAAIIFIIMPILSAAGDNYKYLKLSDMSFEEVIHEGYDTKDTVKNLMKYKEEFIRFCDNQKYEVRFINDQCSQERSSKPLIASTSMTVTVKEEQCHVDVTISFQDGELYSTKLEYDGLGGKIRQFDLLEDEVIPLADKLGMENAFNELKEGYNNLSEVKDGEYIYDSDVGIYDIYISQINYYINDFYISYDYKYSIEKTWAVEDEM